ncbi:MAG: magnesium/cobalt transporter CorA [Syntrophobacterales bacterium]
MTAPGRFTIILPEATTDGVVWLIIGIFRNTTMNKSAKKRSKTIGHPPGALVYMGNKIDKEIEIHIVTYNNKEYAETVTKSFEACDLSRKDCVTWINITGLHRIKDLEYLGHCFQLHPLILEDILHTDQRPKLEEFDTYLFLIIKMLQLNGLEVESEQVSLILGENFVISLHEHDEDIFEPIRQRLKAGTGHLRGAGADYLAYALLDLIVDQYFLILESLGEGIEEIEGELLDRPTPATLSQIHRLKRDTIMMRRAVWPLREVVSRLERSDFPFIQDHTLLYLKDAYDHVTMVIDSIETYRDILAGMLDIYLSSVSNRLNEVMMLLTIMASIFIPLTFIAGVYGMNFKYMPELEWHWGYFTVLFVMALLACAMLMYFRRKGWIGWKRSNSNPASGLDSKNPSP